MRSFNDAIEQLLWPEKRAKDSDQSASLPAGTPLLQGPGPSHIDRTTQQSYLRVDAGYLPPPLSDNTKLEHLLLPWLFSDKPKDDPTFSGIQIGPIPAGTPVGLLSNLDLMSDSTNRLDRIKHNAEVVRLIIRLKHDLEKLPPNPTDDQVRQIFAGVEPELIKFNKCPDFVVNRGHYFGTDLLAGEPGLSDSDKKALIEFVKTF
jgi:hypothetical protein